LVLSPWTIAYRDVDAVTPANPATATISYLGKGSGWPVSAWLVSREKFVDSASNAAGAVTDNQSGQHYWREVRIVLAID
jgi:hypothetical protein